MVIQPHLHSHVIAGLIIALKNQNAVFDGIGEVMLGGSKLLKGAEHTVRLYAAKGFCLNFNSAGQKRAVERGGNKISLTDILGAGADLNGTIADIHLTDPHMVGIGVTFDGDNPADLHILHGQAEVIR